MLLFYRYCAKFLLEIIANFEIKQLSSVMHLVEDMLILAIRDADEFARKFGRR